MPKRRIKHSSLNTRKKKKNLYDIIEGKEDFVEEQIKKLEKSLRIPFSTDIRYEYDSSCGKLFVDLESIVKIRVPDRKLLVSDTGSLQIVRLNEEEHSVSRTVSMIAYVYHIAWSFINISTKIREIDVTFWKLRNQTGWCWFSFKREEFYNWNIENIDILAQCTKSRHVFDLNNTDLIAMKEDLFNYAISNGKYDDNTLLEFSKRYESTVNNKLSSSVNLASFNESEIQKSVNDDDYGYNLSIMPKFDKSFVNYAYKLLDYKVCSLKMFISEFRLTFEGAKDLMGKFLYLNMVSAKDENGNRKVLVESENVLEYKLSWIFPDDSWKY